MQRTLPGLNSAIKKSLPLHPLTGKSILNIINTILNDYSFGTGYPVW
jgi:hypothetical protein